MQASPRVVGEFPSRGQPPSQVGDSGIHEASAQVTFY